MQRFDVVGMTPPRGRLGHSVPTPRLLGKPLADVGPLYQTRNIARGPVSQAMLGGGGCKSPEPAPLARPAGPQVHCGDTKRTFASALDRIRSHNEVPVFESLEEREGRGWTRGDGDEEEGAMGGEDVGHHEEDEFDDDELGMSCGRLTKPGAARRMSITLDRFTGDSMLSYSFNAGGGGANPPGGHVAPDSQLNGSFVSAFSQSLNSSLNAPFLHQGLTSPTGSDVSHLFPSTVRNPNKSIVTIDARSSRILMANETTCEIFGYKRGELAGMKVQNLFAEPYRARHRALVEQNIDSTGNTVLISGKVMDAVTSYGQQFPVSVWMKKVSSTDSSRVIVIIEPVERSSAHFSMNKEGRIVSCDPWFACLFGYDGREDIVGKHVKDLIPSVQLSDDIGQQPPLKQSVTGRTKDSSIFPLTLSFSDCSQELSVGDLYSPTNDCSSDEGDGEPDSTAGPSSRSSSHGPRGDNVTPAHGDNPRGGNVTPSRGDNPRGENMTPSRGDNPRGGNVTPSRGDNPRGGNVTPSQGDNSRGNVVTSPVRQDSSIVNAKVTIYAQLSGMISFLRDGTIHGCNHHITMMLFGYSQQELVKQNIAVLMPDFYNHIGYCDDQNIPLPPLDEEELDELDRQDLFHSVEEQLLSPRTASQFFAQQDKTAASRNENVVHNILHTANHPELDMSPLICVHAPPPVSGGPPAVPEQRSSSENSCGEIAVQDGPALLTSPVESCDMCTGDGLEGGSGNSLNLLSSTPALSSVGKSGALLSPGPPGEGLEEGSMNSLSSLPEGTFSGQAKHKDGSLLQIVFQLKSIQLAGGDNLYCMWISRDLEYERARTADLSMSMSNLDPYRSDQISPESAAPLQGREAGLNQQEELLALQGEYSTCYETHDLLGKGAFGFVKSAQRKADGLVVVVKFLRKSSVLIDCWVEDKEMGRVPLEINLLARLSHPNIVELLEAYENGNYFQMVMEKHGDGLDLFEFIERRPKLTEQLVSYMFRQVVSALTYLHGLSIVHRDIKDENIILDRHFHMKLIDFGSAAYMEAGKLFNTFCGTLEYCSPEVLLGNSYSGPELEMWALGVTLYTLVFGENPFFDVEESIVGHLQPPFLTSPGLMKVILWLLHPDHKSRATLKDLNRDKWMNQPVDVSQYSFESVLGVPSRPLSQAAAPKEDIDSTKEADHIHPQIVGGGPPCSPSHVCK